MNQLLSLTEDLEKGLIGIENSNDTRIQKCIQKIKLCEGSIQKLKRFYRKHPAENPEKEIHFFKKIKPQFTVELKYQYAMFAYLKNKPKGTLREKKKFINQELERSSAYLQTFNEFYTYYKTAAEHFDHLFYRQMEFDIKQHAMLEHPLDREFTCPAGPTLTGVISAEKMIQFLKNQLFTLEYPNLEPTWEFTKKLTWSGSKTDMIELIYALSASGAIQHDLKDAFLMFERMFGVQLGNFYRVYSDIKIKKEPTAIN